MGLLSNIINKKRKKPPLIKVIDGIEYTLGFKVKKKSGKPFKSGLRENTVKDIIKSPYVRGKLVYLFVEDDSMVEVDACEKVEEES